MLNLTLTMAKWCQNNLFFDLQQWKLFYTFNLKGGIAHFPTGKTHLSLSFFIVAENFSIFHKLFFVFLYSLKN